MTEQTAVLGELLASIQGHLGETFSGLLKHLGLDGREQAPYIDESNAWEPYYRSWVRRRTANAPGIEIGLSVQRDVWPAATDPKDDDPPGRGKVVELDFTLYPRGKEDGAALAAAANGLLAIGFPSVVSAPTHALREFPNRSTIPVGPPFVWTPAVAFKGAFDGFFCLCLRSAPIADHDHISARDIADQLLLNWPVFRSMIDYLRGAFTELPPETSTEEWVGFLGEAAWARALPSGSATWLGGFSECDFIVDGRQVEVKTSRRLLPTSPFFSPAELCLGAARPADWDVVTVALPPAFDEFEKVVREHRRTLRLRANGSGRLPPTDRHAHVREHVRRCLITEAANRQDVKRLLDRVTSLAVEVIERAEIGEVRRAPFLHGWENLRPAVHLLAGATRVRLP